MNAFSHIDQWIDDAAPAMVDLQSALVAIPAIAPDSGGDGEQPKAMMLKARLEEMGLGPVENYPAPDSRVSSGQRPNLFIRFPGRDTSHTTWIMAHTDIVPEGDRSKWTSDPFILRKEGDRLIGRGVEDNHQGLVAGIFALKALREHSITPAHNIGCVFVADEEFGSAFGIQYLLKKHPSLFGPKDLVLVPDSGDSTGAMIEIAEKSILWLKIITTGKQCHASRPYNGKNAFAAASELIYHLQGLSQAFPQTDPIFDPPTSTFQPTKKEANIPNINTIPGEDVFYLDCRVMPGIPLDSVIAWIQSQADLVADKHGVSIKLEPVQKEQAATPTPANCPLVKALQSAIHQVHRVEAHPMGIGGGTVAAHFRRHGLHAAVWSTVDESAHQPNEYCLVQNMVKDTKVFARLLAML